MIGLGALFGGGKEDAVVGAIPGLLFGQDPDTIARNMAIIGGAGALGGGLLGGPTYGGFESFGQANPFTSGPMPDLLSAESVQYPADLMPTTAGGQSGLFASNPNMSLMPTKTPEEQMKEALESSAGLAGFPFSKQVRQPPSPPAGGTARMNQMQPYSPLMIAQMLRRNQR